MSGPPVGPWRAYSCENAASIIDGAIKRYCRGTAADGMEDYLLGIDAEVGNLQARHDALVRVEPVVAAGLTLAYAAGLASAVFKRAYTAQLVLLGTGAPWLFNPHAFVTLLRHREWTKVNAEPLEISPWWSPVPLTMMPSQCEMAYDANGVPVLRTSCLGLRRT